MAYFAKISDSGAVLQVITVENGLLIDEDGVEQEQLGVSFCQGLFGGTWVQTSYNDNIRRQFAAIGGSYDAENDVFVSPQPFASWVLDSNYDWQPPVAKPVDDKHYYWNEESLSWVELQDLLGETNVL